MTADYPRGDAPSHQDAVDVAAFYRRYARRVYPVYGTILALLPTGVVLVLFGHWLIGALAVLLAVPLAAWWMAWSQSQLDNTSARARRAIDEAYAADIAEIDALVASLAADEGSAPHDRP